MTKPITVELLLLKKDGSGLRIRLSDARCFPFLKLFHTVSGLAE